LAKLDDQSLTTTVQDLGILIDAEKTQSDEDESKEGYVIYFFGLIFVYLE